MTIKSVIIYVDEDDKIHKRMECHQGFETSDGLIFHGDTAKLEATQHQKQLDLRKGRDECYAAFLTALKLSGYEDRKLFSDALEEACGVDLNPNHEHNIAKFFVNFIKFVGPIKIEALLKAYKNHNAKKFASVDQYK